MLETRRAGLRLRGQLDSARTALQRASARGLLDGVVANQRTVDRLTARLDRLRERWRGLSAREQQLRTDLIALGIDPHTVGKDTLLTLDRGQALPAPTPAAAALADTLLDDRGDRTAAAADDATGEFLDTTPTGPVTDTVDSAVAVQDALDLVGVVETIDWAARGATRYRADTTDPGQLPDPDTDAVLSTALRGLTNRARGDIIDTWLSGAREARAAALADDTRALLTAAATDPAVIAATLGRRAVDIGWGDDPFVTAARHAITHLAADADPVRAAAAELLLALRADFPPSELVEQAAEQWRHTHSGSLGWEPVTRVDWRATITGFLLDDPVAASWAGHPPLTRHRMVEAAIPVAFDRLTTERPDLAAAIADLSTERLAAIVRADLVPALRPGDATTGHLAFDTGGRSSTELILTAHPDTRLQLGPRGWGVTFDGHATVTTHGRDHRVALGYLLDHHKLPIPDWIASVYRPVAVAAAQVTATALAAATAHSGYQQTATDDTLWNATGLSQPYRLDPARRAVIDTVRLQEPDAVAVLERAGYDLDWLLRQHVDDPALAALRPVDAAVTTDSTTPARGTVDVAATPDTDPAEPTADASASTAASDDVDARGTVDTDVTAEGDVAAIDTGVADSAAPEDAGDGIADRREDAPAPERTVVVDEVRAPRVDFELGDQVLVPSGARARVRANIDAVRLVGSLDEQRRPATTEEQKVLCRWSGWGAVPEVFDHRPRVREAWETERGQLRELLGEKGFAAARATTLNAHYTDPAVVAVMWRAMRRAGLPENAVLLEPGCGAGHFVGTAPRGTHMVGVEIEPVSAKIAAYLYPSQQVRNHGFERDFAPAAAFTGAIGNVPFGNFGVYDPIHNADGHTIHNHFIIKSLALTAPGGYVCVLTSAYTSDARRDTARQAIAELGDLVGAVRLPTGAFARQAGTTVVTDVLMLRRREPGRYRSADTTLWAGELADIDVPNPKTGADEPYRINAYFDANRRSVLGDLEIGNGAHGRIELAVRLDPDAPLPVLLQRRLDTLVDRAAEHGLAFTADPGEVEARWRTPGLRTAADLDSAPVLPGVIRFDETADRFEQFRIGHGWIPVTCRGRDKIAQWRQIVAMGETVMDLTEASRSPESTRAERDTLRERLNTLYDDYLATWGPLNRFKLTDVKPRTPQQIRARLDREIDKWRTRTGRTDAVRDGIDPDEAGPYTGAIPDEVLEDLNEKAAKPLSPRKYRGHIEGAIARDPRIGMVLALEKFTSRYDGTHARTEKSPIFTEDTSTTRERVRRAGSVGEAITISVDEHGRPDPVRIAELLDCTVADALDAADGSIYPALDHPTEWEIAEVALSGQVRHKLAAARELAATDPHRYGPLVEALDQVVPPDADPSRIGVRPGAPWVPIEMYRDFLIAEFGLDTDRVTIELNEITGTWKIETTQPSRHHTHDGWADKYGTDRLTGVELFELIANNKAIQVPKTADELESAPTPRFHPALTEAARASATALEDRFGKWLWSDGDRHLQLSRIFNDRYNSYVRPVFDNPHKQFPGLNPKYIPYDYQRCAVLRFLHDETILLDHVVGAGKTLTITMSCLEAKRLEQVRQPWVVVPNHLLAQWGTEAREAYPNAKILLAAELDDVEDRQRFVGQTAVGDWDMVIVPQSVFSRIPMKKEAQIDYLEGEIAHMRIALDSAQNAGLDFSVKQIEKALKTAKERIEKILGQKATDNGLTFEQSGADFLFVDEAHDYKNLSRPSNSADLAVPDGAQRASDLEMKARYLRARAQERNTAAGRPGAPAKAVAFATGTPVTNAMSEIWVLTKFLRPDLLAETGLGHIDNWAGTFARPVTAAEMNITGTRLQMVTRMSEYANVPQLVAMLDQFRDVVTADQIPVRLPVMAGGAPRNIEFDLSQETLDFVADLDERLTTLDGAHLELDNTLKISTDGRNVTMFPPLANLAPPLPENSRVDVAAGLIWRCYTDHAGVEIPADKYGPDMRGVFQLVFADRGTPKTTDTPRTRNVYTELRDTLVRRGMPAGEIAFMHDHDAPRKKTELMEACRDGRVRVLITSTKKGGTGLNVHRALKQLLNLDPSWTAADMEQRIGRIIRQGNIFETVDVVNLVARRSYDAMMYQYVARKAAFVQQIRRHDVPATMEDIGGDFAASWAQTKAAATGDPVFVQQVEADQRVTALEARRDVITNNNLARAASIRALDNSIRRAQQRLPALRAAGDALDAWLAIEDRRRRLWTFPDGSTVPDDKSADLVTAITRRLHHIDPEITRQRQQLVLVELAGVPVTVEYIQTTATYEIDIAGTTRHLSRDTMIDVRSMDSATRGFIQQIRNSAAAITDRVDAVEQRLTRERERLETVQAEPELVFEDTAELDAARLHAEELRLEVNSRENSPDALKRQRLDTERRRALGQYPKWSLDLAPTEAWADKHGTDRKGLTLSVPARMKIAAQQWVDGADAREQQRRDHVWKPVDTSEADWRYGYDRNSGMPGARVWWAARQWHWEAWDGAENHRTGITDRRDDAWTESRQQVTKYAEDRNVPPGDLTAVSAARPYPGERDAAGSVVGSAIARATTTDNRTARSEPRWLPPPLDARYGATTLTEACNEP